MTIDEAIAEIEQSGLYGDQVHQETLVLARDALRAQQQRENPQPLTLDELRKMDGQPVFIASGLNLWGIVIVDNSGRWSGIPFVQGKYFNYNADTREINCYRYQPKEGNKCTQT